MKLAIITVIFMSLALSVDIQARESDRQGARKSSKPSANKSYKPRSQKRDDGPRVSRKQTQQKPKRQLNTPPPNRGSRSNVYNSNNSTRSYDKGRGFGSPKQAISNHKRLDQNNSYRGNQSRNNQIRSDRSKEVFKPSNSGKDNRVTRNSQGRDNRDSITRSRSDNRTRSDRGVTTREIQRFDGNRNLSRPSDRSSTNARNRSSSRLPETMPQRRYKDSVRKDVKGRNNSRRVSEYRPNKRDNFRYQQHRWLVNKQKHRRHTVNMPRQLHRYNNNHYRGQHRYGNWHRGHNHYHYDYRYRYMYNPYQWYDDYYYHAYFNWRWNYPNHWNYSSYHNHYMDPYYCPDDFGQFITTLAVGALILSW